MGIPLFLFLIVIIFARGWFFGISITLVAILCQAEMYGALRSASFRPGVWPGIALSLLMYPMFLWRGAQGLVALYVLIIGIQLGLSVLLPQRRFLDMVMSVFTLVYPWCFFAAMLLLAGMHPEEPRFSVVGLGVGLTAPVFSDIFAMFSGRLFGRHKLSVKVSPKKTVEGAVGGMICSAALITLAGIWVVNDYYSGLALWQYPLLGGLCAVLGQAGDLSASALKRFAGIKDFSKLLPGHGGMMDRMDSILFGAAAAYCYLTLFIRI